MRTDILLVTYRKDYDFAAYCVRSISKFARGFGLLVVLCPESDRDLFNKLIIQHQNNDIKMEIKTYVPKAGYEFNHHQAMKCHADILCKNAAYILHIDSDCIFTETVYPSDYFKDGKPMLFKRAYSKDKEFWVWKSPTEKFLRINCDFETMAMHPAVHHRNTYKDLRNYVEFLHEMPLSEVILQTNAPCSFSEFNAIGSYAITYNPDFYCVIDLDKTQFPNNKLIQGWSWGGVDKIKEKYEQILSK